MGTMSTKKYRELFKMRAEGSLDHMECTKNLFRLLEPIFKPGMKILDVPCGVGHYYRKIKELGPMIYVGVDLDGPAVEMAQEVWANDEQVSFEMQTASNLKFPDNHFDIAFCYNLLLHLPDYKAVLAELFRVSGKYLIVRSLFDETYKTNTFPVDKEYHQVYPSGFLNYNTYMREEVKKFLEGLGPCKVNFLPDNVIIPEDELKKQEEQLDAKSEVFARGQSGKEETWEGMALNYEVLFVEKLDEKNL